MNLREITEAHRKMSDALIMVGYLKTLIEQEGDTLMLLSANPEATEINRVHAVDTCGGWTGYLNVRFYGPTIEEAVHNAHAAYQRNKNG